MSLGRGRGGSSGELGEWGLKSGDGDVLEGQGYGGSRSGLG